jgi:ABC-2 type transport system ATP-binding protein
MLSDLVTPERLANPTAELDRVTVHYGGTPALRDVSVTFERGTVGLLGPNGAGKSTMLRSLLGLVRSDSGTMRVMGLDVAEAAREIRSRVGYMPERDAHVPGMTAVSFVAYCGELSGLPSSDAMQRAHEVLYYVGLGEARYRKLETYSVGMKQRAKLAQALVHDPDLLLLDEPTSGMDPGGRDEMLDLIRDLGRAKGVSLIMSSHVLPDIEYACDHVVMLDRGRVAAHAAIATLTGHGAGVFEMRVKSDSGRMLTALQEAGIDCNEAGDGALRVTLPAGGTARDLFQVAAAARLQVRHLRPSVPTLEDAFARAVGAPR